MLKLIKVQRSVVQSRRESESEFHQVGLAGTVAAIHGSDLGNGHVAFINDQQKIIREIIDQAERAATGFSAVEKPGIVFDSGTVTQFLDHFYIKVDPFLQSFGLHVFAGSFEISHLFVHLFMDLMDDLRKYFFRSDVEVGGEDGDVFGRFCFPAGISIKYLYLFHLITEEGDPIAIICIGRIDLYRIADHPECSPSEIGQRTGIQCFHKSVQQKIPGHLITLTDPDYTLLEFCRVAYTIDTGNGGHHDNVSPSALQTGGRFQAKLLYFVIDRQILFYVGISSGYISFGLVIIVVGNKILDRILRKELSEFSIQLRNKRFIMTQDKSRSLNLLDDIGNGEGLSGTGHPQ